MTASPAPDLSPAEAATLARIEAAEPAPESIVERVAIAIYTEGAWCGVCDFDGWDACSECRRTVREYAHAAIAVLRGPTPADETTAAVDANGCPDAVHHGVDCPGDACRFAALAVNGDPS